MGRMTDDYELKDGTFEAPAIFAEEAVVLPEMEVTISMQDSKNLAAATQAFREHNLVVLVPSSGLSKAIGSISTLVLLQKMLPKGSGAQLQSKGLWRVRVDSVFEDEHYVRVRFSRAGGSDDVAARDSKVMKTVFGQIDEFTRMIPGIPQELIAFLKSVDSPGKLADLCAYSPFFSQKERLELLETLDGEERLGKVSEFFERQLVELKRVAETKTILECPTCIELADRAFELGGGEGRVAKQFLEHVAKEHPEEVLGLLAERYGPAFLSRRSMK